MTIYAKVYPTNAFPEKSQIEQMYQVAYRLDPSIFVPEDVDRFGLNVERLKTHGAVEMKAPLNWLRKHVDGLWDRMNRVQKTMFLMSYMNGAIVYLESIAGDLEKIIGKEFPFRDQLNELHTGLASQLTLDLAMETKAMMEKK